jgi:hypothetical protein
VTKSVLLRIDQEANGDYTVELAAETGDAGWEHQPVVSARIPHDAEAPSPPVVDGQPLDGRSMREAFLAASEPSRVLKEIGEFLGALLFPPPVREAFDRLSQDDALRVMLEVRSPDLQRLPWELARDADAVLPLFLTNGMPWSRISPRRRVQASPAECWPLLRVLLVVGIDTDDEAADTIGAAREIRDVQDQLARYAGFVDVELLNRPSQDELRRTYNRLQPHVLHFVGHGTPGSEAGELLIHAKDGAPAWTWDAGRIAVDLQDWVPTLVLLNACRTVAVNEQNGAWEVIDAFLQLGAQAVIGMQGDVAGDTAARFARALYGALGENEPIDRSVARARAEIQGNGLNTREPWLPCLILNTLAGDVFPRRFALEVADCRHILDGARFNKIQAFVDRREERRALWGQLNGSGAGPAVVAVEGPEGCGKSAFVRWYIGSMALRGRNAAYLDISNGGTLDLLHFLGAVSEELALFPLQRAANQAAFDEWLVEVDRIQHRERGGPAAPAGGGRYDRQLEEGPETGPQEVLAAFVAAVARAAPREPLLLAVDGLASVDPGALSFLIAGLLEPIIEQRLPMQLILVAAEGGVSQLLNERRRLLDSVKSLRIGPIAHSEPASLMMQYLLARGLQRTGSLEELIELTFTSQPGHAGLNTALFAAAELLARNMQGGPV